MKRYPKFVPLSVLVLVLLGLASCSSGDREERLTKLRGKYGADAPAAAVVVEPLSEGAQLYRDLTCNTCHGDDGIRTLLPSYPVLARQGEQYALQQMKDIQSGNRANGQSAAMKAVIANVTEEQFVILADYIANELGDGAQIGSGNVDPESPGALLFKTKTCTACHGKDAMSPILKTYPRIAGHNKEYIIQQMTDIKSGARANSMAVKGMQGIMHLINEEQIAELAEYVSSLPR